MSEPFYFIKEKIKEKCPNRKTNLDYLEDRAEKSVAKALGVEFNFLKRNFLRRGKSKLLTKEEIAQSLVDASLVDNTEQAMSDTYGFLGKCFGNGFLAVFEFQKYDVNGQEKYRLEPAKIGGSPLDFFDIC